MAPYWEHYVHEADIGVRGIGDSTDVAFEQAALALTAVVTDPAIVKPVKTITLHCHCNDTDILFLDWLNAIIFEMSYKKMLFSRFKVTISGGSLSAELKGEKVDIKRHQPVVEIKGATFTTLKVAQNKSGEWIAQTVVDV